MTQSLGFLTVSLFLRSLFSLVRSLHRSFRQRPHLVMKQPQSGHSHSHAVLHTCCLDLLVPH